MVAARNSHANQNAIADICPAAGVEALVIEKYETPIHTA